MRKTTCSKCDKPIEESRRSQRYCKSCHAANMRATRKKHSELSDEQRLKANARAYTNVYIRRGHLVKKPCEICGDPNSEVHHEDYTKPLDVNFYCRTCHLELHKYQKLHKEAA